MCLGIPGRIVRITDAARMMAMADVSGVRREVNLVCLTGPDAGLPELEALLGQWVLIHVGFAMSRIDADEAEKTLQTLRELGEAQAALDEIAAGERALR